MCAISDVICDVCMCCVYVCYVLGYVARLSQQRNPSTTPQLPCSPPSQRKITSKKKINIKHNVCCVMLCACVCDMYYVSRVGVVCVHHNPST